MTDLVKQLSDKLGASAVLSSTADMAGHLEDWRGQYHGDALCVVLPSSTEEVAWVVRTCVAAGVGIVPQGGNTSLCGGSVPDAGARSVVLALGRMRRIRSLDPATNVIEVEAGCVLQTVQEAAAEAGRLYPVSLGAEGSAQIGGTIATNAGGTSVLRYGNTRDNVLGLEVVLPDGEIWQGLYRLRKNNTGVDLKHLFIGSEGTLGIVTAATLKLHPKITASSVAWLALPSPDAALELLVRFQAACGPWLSAFEMVNAAQMDKVVRQVPEVRPPLEAHHPWHLLVELSHAGADSVLAQAIETVLSQAIEDEWVIDAAIAASGAQREAMWQVRHSVSEANKKSGVSVSMDVAVPLSAVPAFIARGTAAVRAVMPGLEVLVVAHLGDGNVHFIPFFGFDAWHALPDGDDTALRIREAANRVAHELGGTFSAEHGVGRTHRGEMAQFKPPTELALMRRLKSMLDPAGLMNPGRLLPAEEA